MKNSLSIHPSFAVLSIYLATKYPGIPGGDAGELVAEACHLGTAHPPGYPLFLILSHVIISMLGWWTTPANCVNIMCCCIGAITCYFMNETVDIYMRAMIVKPNNIVASDSAIVIPTVHVPLAGILFSLSPLTWEYTVGAEVFALNNLLMAIILYQTAKIALSPLSQSHTKTKKFDAHESMKGAFLCGLAISNQHTSILFEIFLIPFVLALLLNRGHMSFPLCMGFTCSFLIGLSPYMYLFFTARSSTEGSWGDTSTIRGLITHILRDEYGTFQLGVTKSGDTGEFWDRLLVYVIDTLHQLHYFGFVLAIAGIYFSIKAEYCNNHAIFSSCIQEEEQKSHLSKQSFQSISSNKSENQVDATCTAKCIFSMESIERKFGSAILCTVFIYLLIWNGIFSNLSLSQPMAIAVQSRFWMQPNLIWCLFADIGFNCVLMTCLKNETRTGIVRKIMLICILVFCFRNGEYRIIHNNKFGNLVSKHGETLLKSIPDNSLLIAHTDLDWNAARYLRICEGHNPNITHISVQLLPFPWFQNQQHLYPQTSFPPILPNVSTNRFEPGNTKLITRFLKANLKKKVYTGGLYIDMKSIKETDLGTAGSFHDFTLIPWGLTYRVFPKMKENMLQEIPPWHKKALNQIKVVRKELLPYYNNATKNLKMIYPRGSWEFACLSVFWDMHYELGLHMLSFALEIGKTMKTKTHVFYQYFESLHKSSQLLWASNQANEKYGSLSYSNRDSRKNCALVYMRFYEASQIVNQTKGDFMNIRSTFSLDYSMLGIQSRTKYIVALFLSNHKSDKDAKTFQKFYKTI